MDDLRIETEGLTVKEVIELEGIVRSIEGVHTAKFWPFAPGTVQYRSLPGPQMSIPPLHILVKLQDGALLGVGAAAARHLYKKIGESIVDKAWDAIKAKLSGRSDVEVEVKLYGPNGEIIKRHKGKR